MNIRNKYILQVVVLLCTISLSMSSCIEEYNADLPTSESNLLVVEGTIQSDTVSSFYLSLTMPLNSTVVTVVNNATIQLTGTDGTIVNGTNMGYGNYEIATPKLRSDAKYNIVVKYNGDTYESEALTPFASTGIESVELNQPTDTSSVNILLTTDLPSNTSETQYYKWTYYETWEVHPDYYAIYYWDADAHEIKSDQNHFARRGWKFATSKEFMASSSAYYSNNQIVRYKLDDISRSDRRLYVLYSCEVFQRSITKAEYEYETERKKISNDMGGLFTPQPSVLPTNIHCTTSSKRVLGYVGCSLNTATYRMFASPDSLSITRTKPKIVTVSNSDENYPGEEEMYERGWLISDYVNLPPLPEEISWIEGKYIDLRRDGCTIVKPDYWPY